MEYRTHSISAKAWENNGITRWQPFVDNLVVGRSQDTEKKALEVCEQHVDEYWEKEAQKLWDTLIEDGSVTLEG